ncbi:MAG: GGDEF domain-containing protein [Pseudomonadota bacterium]
MRLHKSELIFGLLMALIITALAIIYIAGTEVEALAQQVRTPSLQNAINSVIFQIYAVCVVLATSCVVGAVLFYPFLRMLASKSGELEKEAEKLTAKTETFQQAALTDPLTGLQNRRYFDDALAEYLDEFGRIGRPIGVMIIDLDHFKSVNDTYGHDVGDEVLIALGKCLIEFTRYHDIVARLGGEEFAVVAPNLDEHALMKLAQRIRIAIANMNVVSQNIYLRVTASIGIASWDGVENGSAMVKRADENLYHAKHSGRNKVAA